MTNPPPENPAPGEGRLSFDSPEVQAALAWADNPQTEAAIELARFTTVDDGDADGACMRIMFEFIKNEHEARVAAETKLAEAAREYVHDEFGIQDALVERDEMADKLAAAESENARMRKLPPEVSIAPWSWIRSRTLIHIETAMENPHGAGIHICSVPKTKAGEAFANWLVGLVNAPAPTAEAEGRAKT